MPRPKTGSAGTSHVGADVDGELVDISPGAAKTATHRPKLPPNSPFVLAAHPTRLTVIDGRVVHSLVRLEIAPGVDNVRRAGKHGTAWGRMKNAREERGWTIVPGEAAPNGRSYVKRVRVRGGVHHLTIFEKTYAGTDRVGTDEKEYADWLVSLREQGVLPPLAEFAIVALQQARLRKLAAASDKASTIPSKAVEAKQVQAELDAIAEALADVKSDASEELVPVDDEEVVDVESAADEADKPKPKATRKSKTPTAKS